MKTVHILLFQALGEPSTHYAWELLAHRGKSIKHRTQVGEGGMYM